MEITIKPEEIDSYVKNAILASTVGKTIKDEMESAIKDLMGGYNSPIKKFASKYIESLCEEYMSQESVKSLLLEAIAKVVTPEMVSSIVSAGCYELKKRYEDSL